MSEPAVFVKYRNKGSQVWSMDKFENKLIDMRDIYQERKEKGPPLQVLLSLCLRPRARAVCTLPAVPRSTQPSTLRGAVNEYQLSG